jgi:hypothetical protein
MSAFHLLISLSTSQQCQSASDLTFSTSLSAFQLLFSQPINYQLSTCFEMIGSSDTFPTFFSERALGHLNPPNESTPNQTQIALGNTLFKI